MRSDAKHKGNNKPLADYLPIIATVFFTIISFISSYSGIHALMGSVGNALVAFVFAGLFTLALQLMLVYAVFSFKKSHRAGAKFHWLSIYLICVFFSVGFGYSFWLAWFNLPGRKVTLRKAFRGHYSSVFNRLDLDAGEKVLPCFEPCLLV